MAEQDAGLEIMSIASPLLKCVLPGAPEVDARFQQDMFAAKHTFADQPRLTARAFEIAARTGARIIRVFSYWRTVDPDACFDRVVAALRDLADQAAKHGVIIGLENEHACNIATAAETAKVLAALDHPNLKVVWDPANAVVSGEKAVPGLSFDKTDNRIIAVAYHLKQAGRQAIFISKDRSKAFPAARTSRGRAVSVRHG